MPSRRYQDKAAGAASDTWPGRLPRYIRSVLVSLHLGSPTDSLNPDAPPPPRSALFPHLSSARSTATFRNIIQHDGFRGLYRGLGPTIIGYLPTWAIYFAVYDGIKTLFGELPLGVDPPIAKSERLYPAPSAKGYQPIVREHPWSLHLLSAMAAGATSTVCTNPLWVIKTRFMVRSRDLPSFPPLTNDFFLLGFPRRSSGRFRRSRVTSRGIVIR